MSGLPDLRLLAETSTGVYGFAYRAAQDALDRGVDEAEVAGALRSALLLADLVDAAGRLVEVAATLERWDDLAEPCGELVEAAGRFAQPVAATFTAGALTWLRDTGTLWAINRHVFHPRGFALTAIVQDGEVAFEVTGTGAAGQQPYGFQSAQDDQGFQRWNAFLDKLAHPTEREGVRVSE